MTSWATVAIAVVVPAWIAAQTPATPQPAFATPEEAVRALGEAAKAADLSALIRILGPGSEALASSADPSAARQNRDLFVAAMSERWTLEDREGGAKELIVGNEAWPFPIPLVKRAQGWGFDVAAGKEEVLHRRIGRNELAAIRVANTYVKAQKLDAAKRRSLLGVLVADALVGGEASADVKGRSPYHGYYFRILDAQPSGFGLIAWPAQPDVTGVMTFIVNQDGLVYEKSLGRDTPKAAAAITKFKPDKSWTKVQAPAPTRSYE